MARRFNTKQQIIYRADGVEYPIGRDPRLVRVMDVVKQSGYLTSISETIIQGF
jgi:hypothetical protein